MVTPQGGNWFFEMDGQNGLFSRKNTSPTLHFSSKIFLNDMYSGCAPSFDGKDSTPGPPGHRGREGDILQAM